QVEDDALENRDVVLSWLQERGIAVLNVAGPRGSKCPEIYRHTFQLLKSLLTDP
ncbi:YpsA SLOG family protein, partial [Solemya velum gill symbiont]